MYKLFKGQYNDDISGVYKTEGNVLLSIPFVPDNTDYQTFKSQINADEAQLEDADGVLMSPEEAKAFVATLP